MVYYAQTHTPDQETRQIFPISKDFVTIDLGPEHMIWEEMLHSQIMAAEGRQRIERSGARLAEAFDVHDIAQEEGRCRAPEALLAGEPRLPSRAPPDHIHGMQAYVQHGDDGDAAQTRECDHDEELSRW